MNQKRKEYYKNNRNKILNYCKQYYYDNIEARKEYSRGYWIKNKERLKQQQKQNNLEKRKLNILVGKEEIKAKIILSEIILCFK